VGLLTTDQNSSQTDTVWLSKLFIYQNCYVLNLQQTDLIEHLLNPMFYSPNSQTKLRHWSVLSKEWDYQVWGQSNHVCVTNRRLEDNRFSTTRSGQISYSSFPLLHTLRCVFALSNSLYRNNSFYLWMEAKAYLICFLGINLNHSFTYKSDDAHALNLRAAFVGHKAYSTWTTFLQR
jgi:hypothetical protein